jgi:hypothetical protein
MKSLVMHLVSLHRKELLQLDYVEIFRALITKYDGFEYGYLF